MMNKISKRILASAALIAGFGALPAAADSASEAAAETNWAKVVNVSEEGNFIAGNPDAAVKLVEYASYTCGHCQTFEMEGTPIIKNEYVATGGTSFEMRSLVRNAQDLVLSMAARCGTNDAFFGNHAFLMEKQQVIVGNVQKITPDARAAIQGKVAAKDYSGFRIEIAKVMGLHDLMATRGIEQTELDGCLTDVALANKLVTISEQAGTKYNVTGTPSFLINDKLAENVHGIGSLRQLLAATPSSK